MRVKRLISQYVSDKQLGVILNLDAVQRLMHRVCERQHNVLLDWIGGDDTTEQQTKVLPERLILHELQHELTHAGLRGRVHDGLFHKLDDLVQKIRILSSQWMVSHVQP